MNNGQLKSNKLIGRDQVYVAVDLEMTGLLPNVDSIVEIGAVKFQGEEVLDTFQTLINPHKMRVSPRRFCSGKRHGGRPSPAVVPIGSI